MFVLRNLEVANTMRRVPAHNGVNCERKRRGARAEEASLARFYLARQSACPCQGIFLSLLGEGILFVFLGAQLSQGRTPLCTHGRRVYTLKWGLVATSTMAAVICAFKGFPFPRSGGD